MSKYSSLCTAINLVEACDKLMADSGKQSEKTIEIIRDLRNIAKDVRYGGQWNGDHETIATALECCKKIGRDCTICPYKKIGGANCVSELKSDAAAVIRQLTKDLKEAREIATDKRKVAAWQRQDMENGNEPPDFFPWEDDETDAAPAEEVIGSEL